MRRAVGAWVGYSAVTLAFFAPVLPRLHEAFLGTGYDVLQGLWNVWWFDRTLLRGANPFFSDAMWHPYGAPLVFTMLVPLQTTAMALLGCVVPLPLAYNAVVLAGFPLAGIGGYALCRWATRRTLASWVGGLVLMLCPAIVSRYHAGWLNLLYAGFVPLYLVAWLEASEPGASRRWRWTAAALALTLFASGIPNTVFAANLAVCAGVWRLGRCDDRRAALARLWRASLPTLLAIAPPLALIGYYAVAYDYPPEPLRGIDVLPEPRCYLLPFHVSSAWRDLVAGWGFPGAGRTDLACYLGLLVLPLALTGFVRGRGDARVRLCALLFALFLVLSLGTRLLHDRERVRVAGRGIPLPFAVWQHVPVLGAVGQTGRYLLISYAMLGVGVAASIAATRARRGARAARALAAASAAAIGLDFAFRAETLELPAAPPLERPGGSVMDVRRSGLPLYDQTRHQRPLVGGYLNRIPPGPLAAYEATPGFRCLLLAYRDAECRRAEVLAGLGSLDVRYVFLDPDDPRNRLLADYGFASEYEDGHSRVWEVPPDP